MQSNLAQIAFDFHRRSNSVQLQFLFPTNEYYSGDKILGVEKYEINLRNMKSNMKSI